MRLNKVPLILLLMVISCQLPVLAQSPHEYLMQGDEHYEMSKLDKAEESYRKAAEEGSVKGRYNLGNTLYNQERYEEALRHYEQAAMSTDPDIKAKAYHNLGNTFVQNNKYKEAVASYKKALEYSEDETTKENLMMAKQLMKRLEQKQQQQQNQESQDQEKQEQDRQEQNDSPQNNQQKNEENNEDEPSSDDESQPSDNEDQKNKQDQQPSEKKELDKEDARKLLEIIDNEEQKVQEKMRKISGKKSKPKKDW